MHCFVCRNCCCHFEFHYPANVHFKLFPFPSWLLFLILHVLVVILFIFHIILFGFLSKLCLSSILCSSLWVCLGVCEWVVGVEVSEFVLENRFILLNSCLCLIKIKDSATGKKGRKKRERTFNKYSSDLLLIIWFSICSMIFYLGICFVNKLIITALQKYQSILSEFFLLLLGLFLF